MRPSRVAAADGHIRRLRRMRNRPAGLVRRRLRDRTTDPALCKSTISTQNHHRSATGLRPPEVHVVPASPDNPFRRRTLPPAARAIVALSPRD